MGGAWRVILGHETLLCHCSVFVEVEARQRCASALLAVLLTWWASLVGSCMMTQHVFLCVSRVTQTFAERRFSGVVHGPAIGSAAIGSSPRQLFPQ